MTMDHDDMVPVYLEKFKGARVVYYRDGDSKSNNTVSQVFVGLVFAILCPLCVSVIDCAWEGQRSYAAIFFLIVLSRVLIFTYHLSRSIEGATDATCTCDHVQEHNDAWRVDVAKSERGDGLIEAGTIVNWGIEYASGIQKFHGGDNLAGGSDADKIVDDLLQVQWDCGYRRVYSKINEWNLLRVFDMGPTGTSLMSRFCQHIKSPFCLGQSCLSFAISYILRISPPPLAYTQCPWLSVAFDLPSPAPQENIKQSSSLILVDQVLSISLSGKSEVDPLSIFQQNCI